MSERQKVEEYLRLYAIEECLDETMNELVEKRPPNPYVAISRMMEIKSLPEIMDVTVSPSIVGRGLTGVEVVVMTNIGAFAGIMAFRYDLPETGPLEMSPDYTTIQDALRSTLSKIDPRSATDVDRALEAMTNLNSTVSLAASIACCRAAARHSGMTLYRYLADRLGEENPRIPLPVVSILSRSGSTESPLLVSQDISILPTAMSSLASALEAVQCLHRLIVKEIEAEKLPLTVSDCGSLRVTMPHLEDAVKFVAGKLASSGVRGGLKLGIDIRASDFVVHTPNTTDPTFYSLRGAPTAGIDAAGGASPVAAAPAAAAGGKGRKKSTSSAAAQLAAAEPVAAGDTAEEVMTFLGSLLKETEFISLEDPVHSSDFAALRQFPAKINGIISDFQKEYSDKLAYNAKGVAGEEDCRLQIVADVSCRTPEDVAKLSQDSVFNAVKVRLDKFPTVTKALLVCTSVRTAGLALIVGCNENGPETTDTFIADLAVAAGAGQLAAGGIMAGEYSCKYQRLVEIAREDSSIRFVGKKFRKP